MARKSAVRALEADMRTYFEARGYAEVIVFGESALTQQLKQLPSPDRAGRVVIVPHDDAGKAGKLVPAREAGRRPRQVYGHDQLVEIHCWGRDATVTRSDEGAHYDVAYDLYEKAMCAVRESHVGRFTPGDVTHKTDIKDVRFGFVIVQQLLLHGGLFEPDVERVTPPLEPDVSDNAMVFPAGNVAD